MRPFTCYPRILRTENGDARQELLVHLALPDRRTHQDATVRVPIDAPQLHISFGTDGGRTGRTVDQGELAEAATLADRRYLLVIYKDLAEEEKRREP